MTNIQHFSSRGSASLGLPGQKGMTLVVVLVFLVMLMLIGATSMQTAGVEERMAGNGRDKSLAFEAAEITLRLGETAAALADTGTAYKTTCDNGLCATTYAPDPNTYADWQSTASTIKHFSVDKSKATNGLPSDLAANPGYYAEYLGLVDLHIPGLPAQNLIRVTAHAFGRDANTQVTLQSVIYPKSP